MIYLDTHVVAWLFAGEIERCPAGVRTLLDTEDLLISPMVVLELEYLRETGRTSRPAGVVLDTLRRDLGLRVCDLPFGQVIEEAQRQAWTRDPFDRIIVGQASVRSRRLVTRDAAMHDHYAHATWGD